MGNLDYSLTKEINDYFLGILGDKDINNKLIDLLSHNTVSIAKQYIKLQEKSKKRLLNVIEDNENREADQYYQYSFALAKSIEKVLLKDETYSIDVIIKLLGNFRDFNSLDKNSHFNITNKRRLITECIDREPTSEQFSLLTTGLSGLLLSWSEEELSSYKTKLEGVGYTSDEVEQLLLSGIVGSKLHYENDINNLAQQLLQKKKLLSEIKENPSFLGQLDAVYYETLYTLLFGYATYSNISTSPAFSIIGSVLSLYFFDTARRKLSKYKDFKKAQIYARKVYGLKIEHY